MKKTMKYAFYMFICGFAICSFQYKGKMNVQDSRGSNSKQQKETFDSLTESEMEFLEDHVFGQWRFANRVISIDENNNTYYEAEPNLSKEGVKELKETVVLEYKENMVFCPEKIEQFSFSKAEDMYLFAKEGGLHGLLYPSYSVEDMDSEIIHLFDIYNQKGQDVEVPWMKNFIKVQYFPQIDPYQKTPARHVGQFGGNIYVDPGDKDNIYVEFCGLWRMRRN